MEKYVIQEELRNCPGITYYPGKNRLELCGRSIPENPEPIYRQLDEWITLHFEKNSALNISFKLDYINSGSSKCLFDILQKLTDYGRNSSRVRMKWFYEEDDEAMLELGEHYRDTSGIPLEIAKIK